MKEPRLFPNTVAGVLEALEMSFGKGIYADKVVERLLKKNKKWGSRDRSFVAEHTYEMVRWWGLLWAIYMTNILQLNERIFRSYLAYIGCGEDLVSPTGQSLTLFENFQLPVEKLR